MSFWPFWPRMFGIGLFRAITCDRFLANNTKFEPNMHFGILSAGIENGGHWPEPSRSFGHFDSEFQEMTFNIALVYWFRPAPVWLYRIQFNFQLKTKYESAIVSGSSIKLKGRKEQTLQKIISIMDNLSMCCTECIVGMKLIILKHCRFPCIRYSLITNNVELGYDLEPSGVKSSPEVSIDRPRYEWIITDECCPRNIYIASKLQGTLTYCSYFPLYCPPSFEKYKMKSYIHK